MINISIIKTYDVPSITKLIIDTPIIKAYHWSLNNKTYDSYLH